MRDPMSWALPVFRAFGIPVKVHVFFFIITLGLFFRQVKDFPHVWWSDLFLLTVVVLFGVVILHEFGHCFGARRVDGEAKEILIWPLGGLAYTEVPHHWKANLITTAAGPAVNAVICVLAALLLAFGGFLPRLNPFIDPYAAQVKGFDGRTYTSAYDVRVYRKDTADEVKYDEYQKALTGTAAKSTQTSEYGEALSKAGFERALAPGWVVWAYRVFWMSWVMLLFNLLPAYPLDGGRILQEVVWARSSYRQGTVVAAYSGFGVSVIFLILSITYNETLLMGLGLFMLYSSSMALNQSEAEDGPFGYDFSAGYTSLERDDPPRPKRKRPGPLARWLQARKARRIHRENEERQKDEERMDQLLEKIARTGKASLTDEEKRFLERASSRYRNRS